MGVALILVQRPYVTGITGAMVTVLVIYLTIDSIRHRLKNRKVNPYYDGRRLPL